MGRVVVYELLSLDGIAEDPARFMGDWDAELDANLAAVIGRQDAVVLGRRSYDEWSGFWPTSDVEPFATFINTVPKHVATSTPLAHQWAGATVIEGDLVAFVRHLRDALGGDVGVHASISVARALLAAGEVDELRLVVAPRTVEGGRRLLDGLPLELELLESVTSSNGWLLLGYRPQRA
ncbi:dihydrofolate reductase family protein [Cellulomonas alba]|uniref:Dihydrofolate reductase family protein n=1 Tax=Cellulomonas alba TaxID=3053467 RepID=A0ABT7SI27_9CELL|nr:dihydrofolate reductase family protein [Cellulomonas alba]MDM7855825.1 dihydrofolate reductase family protein [Cellulomonas alba]